MAEGEKKFEKTQALREALKKKPQSSATQTPCPACKLPMQMNTQSSLACGNRQCKNFKKTAKLAEVAAAATPKKPKHNHRTAKARDIRAKKRGRLPEGTTLTQKWDGKSWYGMFIVVENTGLGTIPVKSFCHEADGVFRLMEELDCMFWEWFAREATAEEKSRLTFAPDPPSPALWPSPEVSVDTAPESH